MIDFGEGGEELFFELDYLDLLVEYEDEYLEVMVEMVVFVMIFVF